MFVCNGSNILSVFWLFFILSFLVNFVIVGVVNKVLMFSFILSVFFMWFISCIVRSEWLLRLKNLLLILIWGIFSIFVNKLYNIFFCGVFGLWLEDDVINVGVGNVFLFNLLFGVKGNLFIIIKVYGII